ncbi:hypothetical protein D3C83_228890 [compost metagenome]
MRRLQLTQAEVLAPPADAVRERQTEELEAQGSHLEPEVLLVDRERKHLVRVHQRVLKRLEEVVAPVAIDAAE